MLALPTPGRMRRFRSLLSHRLRRPVLSPPPLNRKPPKIRPNCPRFCTRPVVSLMQKRLQSKQALSVNDSTLSIVLLFLIHNTGRASESYEFSTHVLTLFLHWR